MTYVIIIFHLTDQMIDKGNELGGVQFSKANRVEKEDDSEPVISFGQYRCREVTIMKTARFLAFPFRLPRYLTIIPAMFFFAGLALANGSQTLLHDDFDVYDPAVWGVTFNTGTGCTPQWSADPTAGVISASGGVLYLDPSCYRGGTTLWTANPVAIQALPVTLEFGLRFRGDGYRGFSLRMRPGEWPVWGIGSTQ